MTYVITGATGNTGKPLAHALLDAGKSVRIITRDAVKAQDLVAKGAELVLGSSTDADVLKAAFAGAQAVYFMIPPDASTADLRAYQRASAEAGAAALAANQVPYVVTLSSVGAHLSEGGGVVQGLYDMENIFDQLDGTNVLHLRPGYFMENLLGQVAGVKHQGAVAAPSPADLPIGMIATQDIAAYATQRLLDLDFSGTGNVQHLIGTTPISLGEITQLIAAALDKPGLPYYQVPFDGFRDFMLNVWGVGASYADSMIAFTESLNAGRITELADKDAISTPTSAEQFINTTFKYVYDLN
jgi:uncharacterized protein YbjT (DUF2867 family)